MKNTARLDTWDQVHEIRKAAEEALKEVAQRYGLDSTRLAFAADAESIELKFDLGCKFENGMPSSFERLCGEYHLQPSDWNKTFIGDDGEEYKLVGINPRARKMHFQVIITRTGESCNYGPRIPLQKIGGYRLRSWCLALR